MEMEGSSFEGIIVKLCASNNSRKRTAIFRAVGVHARKPAPREADCATNTPDISWWTFSQVFGGSPHTERPVCKRVPGYDTGHFLCANTCAQPFAPTGIGEPGVIFSSPDASLDDTLHVFVGPSKDRFRGSLKYCGIYTVAHAPREVQIDEWHMLPTQASTVPHPFPGTGVTPYFTVHYLDVEDTSEVESERPPCTVYFTQAQKTNFRSAYC
jgi:hypothetical protein